VDRSLKALLDQMETMLAASKKCTHVVGETFTLADIAGTVFCARIHFLKENAMFGPQVVAYWNHLRHPPAVAGATVVVEWNGSFIAEVFEEFKRNKDISPLG
jgi:glutathione S-transferase